MSAIDLDTNSVDHNDPLASLPPTSRPLDLLPPRINSHHAPAASTPDPAGPEDLPQSQPMTATHSASSQNPDGDNGDINAAAPYGTRSRNRGPRINYADDKELDLEIEATGRITKGNSKKSAAVGASTPAVNNGFSAINSVSISNGEAPAQQSPAPSAPVSAPAASKKRKQPGTSAAASGTTTPFSAGQRHQPAQLPHYVASNMMSFRKCGGRLNAKKQLVADDGTALAADGK
jgi:hypothetical protein